MDNLEKLAYQWAEEKLQRNAENPGIITEEALAAAEVLLKVLKKPTMADVEWDDEKHHLAGATLPGGGEVVMLWHDDIDTDHIITDHAEWPRDRLTPNGKRYELREVGAPAEPAHPATLETLEDYENAPAGTIVAEPGCPAWTKGYGQAYSWSQGGTWLSNSDMADTERTVLRKGWGR